MIFWILKIETGPRLLALFENVTTKSSFLDQCDYAAIVEYVFVAFQNFVFVLSDLAVCVAVWYISSESCLLHAVDALVIKRDMKFLNRCAIWGYNHYMTISSKDLCDSGECHF